MDEEQLEYPRLETYGAFRSYLIVRREHIRAGTPEEESGLTQVPLQLHCTERHGGSYVRTKGGVPELKDSFIRQLDASLRADTRRKERRGALTVFRDVEMSLISMGQSSDHGYNLELVVRHFMFPRAERDLGTFELYNKLGIGEDELYKWREKGVKRAWRQYCKALALRETDR